MAGEQRIGPEIHPAPAWAGSRNGPGARATTPPRRYPLAARETAPSCAAAAASRPGTGRNRAGCGVRRLPADGASRSPAGGAQETQGRRDGHGSSFERLPASHAQAARGGPGEPALDQIKMRGSGGINMETTGACTQRTPLPRENKHASERTHDQATILRQRPDARLPRSCGPWWTWTSAPSW